MPSILPRRRGHQPRTRGQSLVEFAMVLPLFLFFIAAVLDLGRVFYANISLNNAAREGAMYAAQEPTSYVEDAACDPATNNVTCRIQFESKDSMVQVLPTDIDLSCSTAGCPGQAGSYVTVEVRGSFFLITPLLSVVFGGQELHLTSSATAQIEYLPDPNTATPPPGPVADFDWSPSSPEPNDLITFDPDSSTGDPTGWSWDFDGDGMVDSVDQYPTHTYAAAGTYNVSLTVVNLSGVNTAIRQVVVASSTPSSAPPSSGPSASPSPTPTAVPCTYPPNVIGQTPGTAQANLINAGFTVISAGDLTNGAKNKVQAQNPDHTTCLSPGATITIHWRPA